MTFDIILFITQVLKTMALLVLENQLSFISAKIIYDYFNNQQLNV